MPANDECAAGPADDVCRAPFVLFALSVLVYVATYFLACSSGPGPMFGWDIASLVILLAGFIVATVFNLVGAIVAAVRICRRPCSSAVVGFLVNLLLPLPVALWLRLL